MRTHIHIAVIIILGLIIYANSVNGKFVWDDYGLVKENKYIKDWRFLPKVFKEDFGSGGPVSSNFYRPIQKFAHMLDYSLAGFNVKVYHSTSILLHILAAICLYFFIKLIFYDANVSFLAGLLFVAHPVNTEAVSYISGISDPLSLLFILLCLILYVKSLDRERIAFYVLSMLSFTLALFSKENAVIVPALILLYHYTFGKGERLIKAVPFFALLGGYILLRQHILASGIHISWQRIPGFFAAISQYPKLLLWPFNLHVEYGDKLFNFSDWPAIAGLLLSSSLIVIAFLKKKSNQLLFFSTGWVFISLMPVSNIYPINESYMMEHWLYAPAAGLFPVAAGVLLYPFKNKSLVYSFRIFIIGLLAFYSCLTVRQNTYWRDPVTLYTRTLHYTPGSWRFYNELGIEYANAGKNEEAVAAYNKALEIKPELSGVYYNLMVLYQKTGDKDKAFLMYQKAKMIDQKALLKKAQELGYKVQPRF